MYIVSEAFKPSQYIYLYYLYNFLLQVTSIAILITHRLTITGRLLDRFTILFHDRIIIDYSVYILIIVLFLFKKREDFNKLIFCWLVGSHISTI